MTQPHQPSAEPDGVPDGAPDGSAPGPEQESGPETGRESSQESAAAATDPADPTEAGTEAEGTTPDTDPTALTAQLAERTADLQRVQAEFLNYKRRVERDRELVKQNATYAALAPITEVLDTIDRAREHGELDAGLRAVADQLERVVAGVGLVKYGAVGDRFDPSLHEALSHIGEDPEVTVTTCKVVAKAGYRIGDRVVRAAQVLVVDPVPGSASSPQPTDTADQGQGEEPGEEPDGSGPDAGHQDDQ